MIGDEFPPVSPADSFSDQQFFSDNPQRRHYARPGPDRAVWVIRRRGRDVFLRTLIRLPGAYQDSERAAEAAWWLGASPHLTPEVRKQLATAARRSTKTLRSVAPAARSAGPAGNHHNHIPNIDLTTGGES